MPTLPRQQDLLKYKRKSGRLKIPRNHRKQFHRFEDIHEVVKVVEIDLL